MLDLLSAQLNKIQHCRGIMESDFLTIFCIVVAFIVGYFFNDVISMLFDSKPMDDQAYQEEQRRRLEASKNNRKIDNELG